MFCISLPRPSLLFDLTLGHLFNILSFLVIVDYFFMITFSVCKSRDWLDVAEGAKVSLEVGKQPRQPPEITIAFLLLSAKVSLM